MRHQEAFLIEHGWKPVPGDNGGVAWKAPLTVTGKAHYFALDAAYELETTGPGILAYSTEELTGELLRAKDVDFMAEQEALMYGVPIPNLELDSEGLAID
jgi:hypothetical protein